MSTTKWLVCALVVVCVSIRQGTAAPAPQEQEYPPMPSFLCLSSKEELVAKLQKAAWADLQGQATLAKYEYKYDVEDQEKALYFGANEAGDAQGKVIGGYRVLLPDGRLMTVEYSVEGESGFVPKITFEDNASPFGKGK